MKTLLNRKQTKHLIDLGVPEDKATYFDDDWDLNKYPRYFTLTDLLEILPNKISYNYDSCFLMIIRDVYGNYSVGYAFETFEGPTFCNGCEFGGELIDALYALTVWCIENGHLKFE